MSTNCCVFKFSTKMQQKLQVGKTETCKIYHIQHGFGSCIILYQQFSDNYTTVFRQLQEKERLELAYFSILQNPSKDTRFDKEKSNSVEMETKSCFCDSEAKNMYYSLEADLEMKLDFLQVCPIWHDLTIMSVEQCLSHLIQVCPIWAI